MSFENELTYTRMKTAGREREFHISYQKGVEAARKVLGKEHPLMIGGREVGSGATFTVYSPSDRSITVGKFQSADASEVREAVDTALESFRSWSSTDYRKRVTVVRKAAEIMSAMKFELAAIMTFENGKNRYEAVADVDEAIDFLRYYSELMMINKGYRNEMGSSGPSENNVSLMKPYGVWAVIPPFNFPLAIACGMTTGALITGNTVVLKPSSYTPLMSLKLYEIYRKAGLPDGVLNYITGPGGSTGAALVGSPNLSGIAFTGSREVGLETMRKFTEREFKPFIAELGGKNAVVVAEDADLDAAAEGTARAAFGYSGQKCSAASRVIVEEGAADRFTEKLLAATEKLRVGNPVDEGSFTGPVISTAAVDRYRKAVEEAAASGRILSGGHVIEKGVPGGNYVEPLIVDMEQTDARIFREELFLPFLCLARARDIEEALDIVNRTDYGLTAGIFTQSRDRMETFFNRVEAGVCYANKRSGATTGAMVGAQPFVGWKMSGSTGKGAGGLYYLPQFMREQSQAVFS